MKPSLQLSAIIPEKHAGKRLDQALAEMFPDHSRSRLQGWIRSGDIKINATTATQRQKVSGGETVELNTFYTPQVDWNAEEIPLNVLYEDEYLLVINKPAGLVVHPGAGNPEHTLLNALLNHDQDLAVVPRAGIVHRLDKDTSGIMVVARKPESHTFLVDEMQKRSIKREYEAIVTGAMTSGGSVDKAIGRHPTRRTRMAITANGKPAITHYRIIKKFRSHTHVRVILETGRTHQIRVHLAHIRFPIVGDPVYSGRTMTPRGASEQMINALRSFARQALHARSISLPHPESRELLSFTTDLPEDMQSLLAELERNDKASG